MISLRPFVLFAFCGAVSLTACDRSSDSKISGEPSADAASSAVAARIGDRTITLADVDSGIESELKRLDLERYRARKTRLDELINEALVEQKAKSLGVPPEELAKKEMLENAPQPSEEKMRELYDRAKAQNPGLGTFEELKDRIRDGMMNQAVQARQAEYIAGLRKDAKVEVVLQPPRVEFATDLGMTDGPKDAPIKLVEFSDYQCPFCSRSQETVKQVLEKYKGKIHHVFMDFPLAQLHPMATPAAEASRCAGEQGKYWEYHRVLFERQRELSNENFGKWATELGLDGAKFEACVASNRFDDAIRKSIEVGRSVGVTGTPGFFVNGVMINGAQPLEVFVEAIEEELAQG